jgi:hypothetical protein
MADFPRREAARWKETCALGFTQVVNVLVVSAAHLQRTLIDV